MHSGIILIFFGILGISIGMPQDSLGGIQGAYEEATDLVHGHDSVKEDGHAPDPVLEEERQGCRQTEGRSAEAQLKLRIRLRRKRSVNCLKNNVEY